VKDTTNSDENIGGSSLVFAMLDHDISWLRIIWVLNLFLPYPKSEYDVFDTTTGDLIFQIREREVGFLSTLARKLGFKQSAGFNAAVSSPDGKHLFRCEQGSGVMKPSCKVFSADGTVSGALKVAVGLKPKSTIVKFGDTADTYETKGDGIGIYAKNHEITKNERPLGRIREIDESEARTLLGAHFEKISMRRKYLSYNYHLSASSPEVDIPLIISRVYQISHLLGL